MEATNGNGSYHVRGKVFDSYFLNEGRDFLVFKLNDGIKTYNVLISDYSKEDIRKARGIFKNVKRYVFDLNDGNYFDSTVFGTMAELELKADSEGADMVYVVHNADAEEMFKRMDFPCDNMGNERNRVPGIEGDYTKSASSDGALSALPVVNPG